MLLFLLEQEQDKLFFLLFDFDNYGDNLVNLGQEMNLLIGEIMFKICLVVIICIGVENLLEFMYFCMLVFVIYC